MQKSRIELTIGLLGLVCYVLFLFLDLSRVSLIFGFIFGVWIITRGSEVAVEGLKDTSIHIGLREYDAGVLSSLASNFPELALASLLIFEGLATNSGELIDIAVLSVIIASGFNVLLLGLLIVMISWNEGEIEIPYDRIAHESDLIRMTIIICSLVFVLGVICGEGGALPREVGLFMLATYVAYMLFLLKSKRKRMETFESHKIERPFRKAVCLLILGFVSVFIGGEVLTESAEFVLNTFNLPLILVATIIGALGSIPEHGVALIGARKGLTELGVANLLAGISQAILVVFGVIALLVSVPLGGYVLFQLVAVAVSLWLVKKAILDDGKLTIDEGIFILILQILLFTLLEELAYI